MQPRTARPSFVDRFLFDWYPAEALGAARFYFGLGLTFYLLSQYPQLLLLDPWGPHFHFTRPIWYFERIGIERSIPWLNLPVMLLMAAACLAFAFGKWTKPAIVVILITMFYLKGVRDSFSGDVHHREVPVFALLVLFLVSKCDRMFGIDARRRKLAPIEDWEASWPLRAMQVWVAMFYFWALMAKLRISGLDWFTDGGRIQKTLISRALRDGVSPDGEIVNLSMAWDLAQMPQLVFLFGAMVFAFELLFPIILFVRNLRIRVAMIAGGVLFHIANFLLMNVQFYLYPFVFVTFFNMMPVHEWLKAKLRMKPQEAAPARP
jgi:hypothetical protein